MSADVCPQCAAPAEPGHIFCQNCGATLRPSIPLIQSHNQTPMKDAPQVARWISRSSLVFGRQPIEASVYTYVCVNPKCPQVTQLQEHNFSRQERIARGELGLVTCSCCGRPVEFVPDTQHFWPSIAVGLLSAVIVGGVIDVIAGKGVGMAMGMSVGVAVGTTVQKLLAKRAAQKLTELQGQSSKSIIGTRGTT